MKRDEWDDWASSLFDAGRREAPDASSKRRTLERALARSEQHGTRPILPLAFAALAAALFGAFLLLPRGLTQAPISAEQPRPRQAHAAPAESLENASEPAPPAPAVPSKAPAPRADMGDGSAARKPSMKPAAPAEPTLEAELTVLDRARAELAAGQPNAALASLDHYDRVLRGVHLALEARLLRIQALATRGDRAQAAALARELVAQHPDSPLAERARSFTTPEPDPIATPTGERP